MKKGCIFLWLWWLALPACAQLDSVAVYLQRIKEAEGDSMRLALSEKVAVFIDSTGWGDAALKPVRFLGYKPCTNAEAELYSWAVPLARGQAFYNLFRFREGGRCLLVYLPDEKGENSGWLYYDWLAFRSGKEEYYALLGWSASRNTNRKIVQTVRFGEDGRMVPKALMRRGNSRSASLAFEYAPDGSMMLKHDKKGKRILFDHLAPVDKKYEGYFMFYGADASYDALVLKGGEWWFQENVKQ